MIELRSVRWVEHVTCMGEIRDTYRIFVRKSEGKRQLVRPRYRWEAKWYDDVAWVHLFQDMGGVRGCGGLLFMRS
jgi:hypothetical protein